METKKEIRKEIIQKRDALSFHEVEQKSKLITSSLLNTPEYRESEYILLYSAFRNEVRTNAIFEDAIAKGKQVYYPKIFGDIMEFYKVTSMSELHPGCMGILEPDENSLKRFIYKKQDNGLVITPGVAFDPNGNRIGYGKGFYDKYLTNKRILSVIALAYSLQIVDNIPSEANDIKMDKIITDQLILANMRIS